MKLVNGSIALLALSMATPVQAQDLFAEQLRDFMIEAAKAEAEKQAADAAAAARVAELSDEEKAELLSNEKKAKDAWSSVVGNADKHGVRTGGNEAIQEGLMLKEVAEADEVEYRFDKVVGQSVHKKLEALIPARKRTGTLELEPPNVHPLQVKPFAGALSELVESEEYGSTNRRRRSAIGRTLLQSKKAEDKEFKIGETEFASSIDYLTQITDIAALDGAIQACYQRYTTAELLEIDKNSTTNIARLDKILEEYNENEEALGKPGAEDKSNYKKLVEKSTDIEVNLRKEFKAKLKRAPKDIDSVEDQVVALKDAYMGEAADARGCARDLSGAHTGLIAAVQLEKMNDQGKPEVVHQAPSAEASKELTTTFGKIAK